jgi:hypothetical protein
VTELSPLSEPRRPGFEPGSGHVGFVVDKVALGQVFSKYFCFPCQSSFHQLLHNRHHISFGAGTIGQQWPQDQVDSVSLQSCNNLLFSTDDEPDSVFLHVSSADEEQRLRKRLDNTPFTSPISSSASLHSSRTASRYWTSLHIAPASVSTSTRPSTRIGYKMSSVVTEKRAYSKWSTSLTTDESKSKEFHT